MRLRAFLLLLTLLPLLAPNRAGAEGTPAGTDISSRAVVAYTMSGSHYAKTSNTVTTLVDEVLDVAVTWQDASSVQTVPGALGATLAFRLTNIGNGQEAFALLAEGLLAGDDFDPIPGAIHLDNDGNGRFDPTVDPVYVPGANDPLLPADGFAVVFLRSDIPTTAQPGHLGDSRLEVRAVTGSGAPGTSYDGAGDQGRDAVVGASGGLAQVHGSYEVTAAAATLAILKTATVRDPYGGNQPVSGAVVTYELAVSAEGTGNADGVVITDAIPQNTTYNPGSLALDGSPLTDAADGDAGDVGETAPATLTVEVGDVAAGAPGSIISFSVTID